MAPLRCNFSFLPHSGAQERSGVKESSNVVVGSAAGLVLNKDTCG